MRVSHVILYARDLSGMKSFYRDRFGLAVREDSDKWVELDTAGCTLALHRLEEGAGAIPDAAGGEEVQVSLQVDDIEAYVAGMRGRGMSFRSGIRHEPFGRMVGFRDSEGNLVCLHEPNYPVVEGTGPRLSAVILNCADVLKTLAFYRDQVGLAVRIESSWWTEFDLAGTALALHPWSRGGREVAEHGIRPVVFGFHTRDVRARLEELRGRGVKVVSEPSGEMFGLHAEVADPVGNIIILRQPQERAAAAPAAMSGLAGLARNRPKKKAAKKVIARRRTAKKKATRKKRVRRWRAAKVKAARIRMRMKKRPATGRLRKAERRTLKRAATSRAQRSKGRAVKRRAGAVAQSGGRRGRRG